MSKATTDNLNELFDIVDENDQVIGQATRGQVHGNPKLIHRSVGVAVLNTKDELILQQRCATKDTDPLLWTISCSGHVGKGDSYRETAIRELEEELGIRHGLDNRGNGSKSLVLKKVAKFLYRSPIETEMAVLYRTVWDGRLSLQAEEIQEGRFFTRKTLFEAIQKGKVVLSRYGKISLEKLGWKIT